VKLKALVIFSLIGLCFACENAQKQVQVNWDSLHFLDTPCKDGGEANLHVNSKNELILSWVEYLNENEDALYFSKLKNNKWSKPSEISRGTNWFVNWADFPSVSSYKNNCDQMVAHWLQKSDSGTYDYDVRISQSKDQGLTWSPSFIIHQDSISAEHGFVSMVDLDEDRMIVVWLDGRNTKFSNHDHAGDHHHHHLGAMTLRTASFDIKGNIYDEIELDSKVCDCCQTGMVMTHQGPVVVYRDRTNEEIRDISIVRKVDGYWTDPKPIYKDGWKISGCPVNGPAIDAIGETVVVAWYTIAEGQPKVFVKFSKNSGEDFGELIEIESENPLGRADLVLINENKAVISWMEEHEDYASIKLMEVDAEGKFGLTTDLVKSSASRKSGFPRMVKRSKELVLAWTEVDSLQTRVKVATISLK